MEKVDWYKDWFNTPYYHILYKHRNDKEAEQFIRNIARFLEIDENTHILDVPCGKGRHSKFLNSLGFRVTGADLSTNSITFAQQFENDKLNFSVHDMKIPFMHSYDVIVNLFTSFGYFSDDENLTVLQNIKNALKENGRFVFDFLNAQWVKTNLVQKEIKVVDSIPFVINREIVDGEIRKHISFFDQGQHYSFTEQVKYLDYNTLKEMFTKVGFVIEDVFGDYELSPFDENQSERLVLIAK